jgi:hypothetical protein
MNLAAQFTNNHILLSCIQNSATGYFRVASQTRENFQNLNVDFTPITSMSGANEV